MSNKEVYGVVYKITNLVNNKCYIGQTIQKPPKRRFYEHIGYAKNNKYNMVLPKAIKKYGKENFKFEIIDTAYDAIQLSVLEGKYITLYKSHKKEFGYNLHSIIEVKKKPSKETKLKTSISLLNKKRKDSSSKYYQVHKSERGWYCDVKFQDFKYQDIFENEIECAKARDIAVINSKYAQYFILNFPELQQDYIDNKIIIKSIRIKPSNCVYYRKDTNRWRFTKKGYKEKLFKTKEEAEKYSKEQLGFKLPS